ncbi:MAG: hypothetical protein R2795_20740 [Saprospiraceae bacterium]
MLDIDGYVLFADAGILHSTAYDNCSDAYYITTPIALQQEAFESYLIEVDLTNTTPQDKRFSGFLFGVEVQE